VKAGMIIIIMLCLALVSATNSAQAVTMYTSQAGAFLNAVNGPKLLAENTAEKKGLKSATGSYHSILSVSGIYGLNTSDLWLFSAGDASIRTICADGKINTISFVEEKTTSFWFLLKWFEIKEITVYGH
jgi:hypothetical protein